ncbi:cadherin-related family member 5-like [Arapaima gigas]
MGKFWRTLLCLVAVTLSFCVVEANLCLGGQDVFASVRENSPTGEFIANVSIAGDPGADSVRLCLTGENADWFFLEGKTIRLNSSFSRVLDREVHGSVLMAALTCFVGENIQSEYRIMVEILNENDNKPVFFEETIQPVNISELAAMNSIAFTVKAADADGDTIMYVIDRTSPDANYFRIDLPNSGQVILVKTLDYETQTQLRLIIYALEMSTKERFSTSATITVNILDGDDLYPQFQPCTLLSQSREHLICANPVYTANITDAEQNITLNFSPGPIHAVDGDTGLGTRVLYTILSGADSGRFNINNLTGEVTLTRAVEDRLLTPTFRLQIVASQVDDPKKYSVATAVIHVLAENRFPPEFNSSTYQGFVVEGVGSSLVSTYGNQVLVLQAVDRDFKDGINPKIRYSLWPKSNNTKLYHITQEGHLIARSDNLRVSEKHFLEVLATDQESGEVVRTSVDVEVLQRGPKAPRSPFGGAQLYGFNLDSALVGGITGVLLLLLVAALLALLRLARRWRQRQDPVDRASVAQGKHPNVVNPGRPLPLIEELSYYNKAFADHEASGSGGSSKHRGHSSKEDVAPKKIIGSKQDSLTVPNNVVTMAAISESLPRSASPSIMSNGKHSDRSTKSVSFNDKVMLREIEVERILRFRSTEVQTEDLPIGDVVEAPQQRVETGRKQGPEGVTDAMSDVSGSHFVKTALVISEEPKASYEAEQIENPYKSVHPMICASDDEEDPVSEKTQY